jgi:hypothetical protein
VVSPRLFPRLIYGRPPVAWEGSLDLLIPATLYGGFFAVDLRLLGFLVLLALLLASGTVLAIRKLRFGKGMTAWVATGALVYLALLLLAFHWVLDYPVLVIRSFFEIK